VNTFPVTVKVTHGVIGMIEKFNHALAYPKGRVTGGSTPPLNQNNFVLYVCKIYSPGPALVFIKSNFFTRNH